MAIRLTNLERQNPGSTVDNPNPAQTSENTYVYKDLSFDLEFNSLYGNVPVNKRTNTADLKDMRDVKDIMQSLENLFNTSPGQRLTNPYFGLNLSRFLFDPVTQITADSIGRAIFNGVGMNEPRISISELSVFGYPDQELYKVTFNLDFTGEVIGSIGLNGNVTSGGFKFEGVN